MGTVSISGKGALATGDYLSLGGLELPPPSSSVIRPIVPDSIETLGGKSRKEVLERKYMYEVEWGFLNVADYNNLESAVNNGGPIYFIYKKYPQSELATVVVPKLEERTHIAMKDTADFYSNVRVSLTEVLNRI